MHVFPKSTPRGQWQPAIVRHSDFESVSSQLVELSAWLTDLQSIFRQHGFNEFYIGGGSSRDLLDHVYRHRSLKMRDLDIFLFNNKLADMTLFTSLVTEIETRGIARRRSSDVKRKKRGNPAQKYPARYNYVAGLGAHLFQKNMPILSLSLFHSEYELDINGLLNIDRIYLRIPVRESLQKHLQRLVATSPDPAQLAACKLIKDPTDGYNAWVAGEPTVIHWIELERAPVRHAFRVIRSFAKAGQPSLPNEVAAKFRTLTETCENVDDEVELRRSFVKVFADRYWAEELSLLSQLGVLRHLSPAAQHLVAGKSSFEIRHMLDESAAPISRAQRLLVMSGDARAEALLVDLPKIFESAFEA